MVAGAAVAAHQMTEAAATVKVACKGEFHDLRHPSVDVEKELKHWHAAMVDHHYFHIAINALIVLNVAQMGISTDVQGEGWDTLWMVCEQFFTAIFFIEMIFKMKALHWDYFKDRWNLFDCFIVCISCFGVWVMPIISPDGGGSDLISLPRMLRLLRMIRMMRVVPQFRVLFDGILSSFHAMFWVAMLSVFVLYMFAVAAVTILGRADSGYKNFDDNADAIALGAEDQLIGWNNYQYFGTVSRSLMTLMNLVIMAELDTVLRPVWEVQPTVALVLMSLAFLFTFCFFNILIGMIMDSVMQSVSQLESESVRKVRRQQMDYAHKLAGIMFDHDSGKVSHHIKPSGDGDAPVSHPSLQTTHGSHLSDLSNCLHELDLPHGFSLDDLFDMFDIDGKREATAEDCLNCIFNLVTNNTFQSGCQLHKGIGQLKRKMHSFQENIREEMAAQHKELLAEIRRISPGAAGSVGAGSAEDQGKKSIQQIQGAASASAGGLEEQATTIQIQGQPSTPTEFKVPDFQVPECKVGAQLLKAPEFKMPEVKVPEYEEEASQAIAQIEEVLSSFNRRHGFAPQTENAPSKSDASSSRPQQRQVSVPAEPSSNLGGGTPNVDPAGVQQRSLRLDTSTGRI